MQIALNCHCCLQGQGNSDSSTPLKNDCSLRILRTFATEQFDGTIP